MYPPPLTPPPAAELEPWPPNLSFKVFRPGQSAQPLHLVEILVETDNGLDSPFAAGEGDQGIVEIQRAGRGANQGDDLRI